MLAVLLDKTMLTSGPKLLQHSGYFVSSMLGQQYDPDSVMWGSRHPRVRMWSKTDRKKEKGQGWHARG